MVDSISNLSQGKANQRDPSKSNRIQNRGSSGAERSLTEDARPTVDVELSKAVQEAEERALFDSKKVDSIKEAIQNGSYPLDSRKIAENFLELERLI